MKPHQSEPPVSAYCIVTHVRSSALLLLAQYPHSVPFTHVPVLIVGRAQCSTLPFAAFPPRQEPS